MCYSLHLDTHLPVRCCKTEVSCALKENCLLIQTKCTRDITTTLHSTLVHFIFWMKHLKWPTATVPSSLTDITPLQIHIHCCCITISTRVAKLWQITRWNVGLCLITTPWVCFPPATPYSFHALTYGNCLNYPPVHQSVLQCASTNPDDSLVSRAATSLWAGLLLLISYLVKQKGSAYVLSSWCARN